MSFLLRSDTEVHTPRAITSRSILANHNSTWFSQDEYVGVKCISITWGKFMLLNLRRLALAFALAASLIPHAQADTFKYEFSGAITQAPIGGTLGPAFGEFFGKPATFTYVINSDAQNLEFGSPNIGRYDAVLSALFSLGSITGSVVPQSIPIQVIDGTNSYNGNSDNYDLGFMGSGQLSGVNGVPTGFTYRFTQFSLIDFTGATFASNGLPTVFALNSFGLRIFQLTFQETPGGNSLYSDQMRADFDSLTITRLSPSSTAALSATPNPTSVGQAVAISATFAGSPLPTGTVTFKSDGVAIAGCESVSLSSGVAACIATFSTSGTKAIIAEYSGSAIDEPSISNLAGGLVISAPTYSLAVGLIGTGSGIVTSGPAGISCGATCTATFESGTLVTLSAAADPTSMFGGWSGACAGTGPCTIVMDAAKNVTTTFTAYPTSKDQCKNDGWRIFGFTNQGQCIRFVNTGR